MPTGSSAFPATPDDALAWLQHGGDPNALVNATHATADRHARNPWWVEAFWRLYQESGSLTGTGEPWARVVVDALARGADPNVTDADQQDPMPYLFGFGFTYDERVWDAWLQRPGALVNARNLNGHGVLHTLVFDRQYRGSMPVLKLLDRLWDHGLDVNTVDQQGQGALHWLTSASVMTRQAAPMVATWLGEHGLDGEQMDRSGWSGRERLVQAGMTDVLMAFEDGWSRWERDQLRHTVQTEPAGLAGVRRTGQRL